jgi:hypothetical protein
MDGRVALFVMLFAVSSVRMDLGLFNPDCTFDSPVRYSRQCEFFSGIPEDQTYVCATVQHCCFMTLRCFGWLFATGVDTPPINPITGDTVTTYEVGAYLSACPYTKCNQHYEYARLCKGNPDGGYDMDGYRLKPWNKARDGKEFVPCDDPGTCELVLPYSTEIRSHEPYTNLQDCLEGLHYYEGGNTRNCMRRFIEAHRRCITFAVSYLQGDNPTILNLDG